MNHIKMRPIQMGNYETSLVVGTISAFFASIGIEQINQYLSAASLLVSITVGLIYIFHKIWGKKDVDKRE